jgi:hypothetical protein
MPLLLMPSELAAAMQMTVMAEHHLQPVRFDKGF